MAKTKWLDWNEFREAGYLLEVNRLFFHPLGLALAVNVDDDGNVTGIHGIMDSRDDPEGFIFGELDTHDKERAQTIDSLRESKRKAREKLLGDIIQQYGD